MPLQLPSCPCQFERTNVEREQSLLKCVGYQAASHLSGHFFGFGSGIAPWALGENASIQRKPKAIPLPRRPHEAK